MSVIDTAATESCPVCGERTSRCVHCEARDPITLKSFRVVECSACGIVYTAPRPLLLDPFYPRLYRAYGPLVTLVLKMFYNLRIPRWARLKPHGGSVLEVGCGPGLMLAAFHRRGWSVLGVERDESVAETARRASGLEIVTTPVAELSTDLRFDLIILFQVLEHMRQPVPLLRECARRLAPGGRVIINVPNFSSWQSRFAGSKWFHLDVPRHLVHYTPETLAATLERSGLELADLSFTSPEHDPYGWVESTMNRLTSRSNTLTRFLMGLDPFGPAVLFSCVLAFALVLPAVLLAGTSWVAGRGALMEATAIATMTPEKQNKF